MDSVTSVNFATDDDEVYFPVPVKCTSNVLSTDHSMPKARCIACALSLCITVDILQHSMPLAFLPSVFEDRGHTPMEIAATLGVYYWTGFLACCLLTAWQAWCVVNRRDALESDVILLATAQRYIKYLVAGLGIGMLSLFVQACDPSLELHFACRFVQGFCGAFLFFYTLFLSASLFEDKPGDGQRVFAMTMASLAMEVAECSGSVLGAALYDSFGQSAVFMFLGSVSFLNQVILLIVLAQLKPAAPQAFQKSYDALRRRRRSSTVLSRTSEGLHDLLGLFWNEKLVIASIMVIMESIIKSSVEEILPFHADHRWDMRPLGIGYLFMVVSIGYILFTVILAYFWSSLGRFQVHFSALCLTLLGGCSLMAFSCFQHGASVPVFVSALFLYGGLLGLTHTPANLILADAIEQEGACKGAANGLFNTAMEAGGSLGFLWAGKFAEHYSGQMFLMFLFAIAAVICSALVMMFNQRPAHAIAQCVNGPKETASYGAVDTDHSAFLGSTSLARAYH